jgi:inosine-uridine nucleoside N-ribohydrolase
MLSVGSWRRELLSRSGEFWQARAMKIIHITIALTIALLPVAFPIPADGASERIPAILSTDIGDDIDDTWALALLLRSPEVDVKLVLGDFGRRDYRAKLVAKFLEASGRADIPVGMGLDVKPDGVGGQADWVKDYNLARYPGKVHADGVQALIDTVMKSPQPVVVIGIGPLPNIAEALRREPGIARRARFVGMQGSVRVGYGGGATPAAEWNVKCDPAACRAVFAAPWDVTVTPLDTCGLITLTGEDYARVRDADHPIARALMANYRIWSHPHKEHNPDERSSVLFDTVAVYLAITQDLCRMEQLGLRVEDDGRTVVDDGAKKISIAASWLDQPAYHRWLAGRLSAK